MNLFFSVSNALFTKPASWRGHDVPPVLLSGDHAAVARWRREQALRRTAAQRPDLLERLDPRLLDTAEWAVLAGLGWSSGPAALRPPGAAVAD